jgi:O-antigen ligase
VNDVLHKSRELAGWAACAAAFGVPLIYISPLESPFTVPKLALLQLSAALCLTAWALAVAATPGRKLEGWLDRRSAVVLYPAVAFVVTSAISWLTALPGPVGAPYGSIEVARHGSMVMLGLGTALAATDRQWRRNILYALAAGAGTMALIGLYQNFPELADWIYDLRIPRISPPGTTFGNRNLAGETAAQAIPLTLTAVCLASGRRRLTIVLAAAVACEMAYLGVSRTRGAWLGGVAGMIGFVIVLWPRLRLPQLIGTALVLAFALGITFAPPTPKTKASGDLKRMVDATSLVEITIDKQSSAVRTRFGLWRRSYQMWRSRPVFGVGTGNWAIVFPRYAEPGAFEEGVLTHRLTPRRPHDDLVERFSETGPLGLAALLGIYVGTLVVGLRARPRRRPRGDDPAGAAPPEDDVETLERRAMVAGGAGCLAALLGSGLTGFPLALPGTCTVAGIGLGMLFVVRFPGEDGAAEAASEASSTEAAAPSPAAMAPAARSRRQRRRGGASGGARAGASPAHAAARSEAVPVDPQRLQVALAAGLLAVLMAAYQGQQHLRSNYCLGEGQRLIASRETNTVREGLRVLTQGLTIAPQQYNIAVRLAYGQMRASQPGRAVGTLKHALSIEPYSPYAWATLASAQLRTGDFTRALASAQFARTLIQRYPKALVTEYNAAKKLGQDEVAETARERLSALAKDDSEAAKLLPSLK